MQRRINALINVVDDGDKVEIVLLNNAFVAATKEQKNNPGSKTYKEWKNIKDHLEQLLDRLDLKYHGDDVSQLSFKTQTAVREWLTENGWKIGKSQLSTHCRAGFLRPGGDGLFTIEAVQKYAKMHLKRLDTGQKVNDHLQRMHEEKLELELKSAKVKLERDEHDLSVRHGKYVLRDDFELAIVGRAVTFMAHLNHTIQQSVGDWIDLVDGDQAKAPQLVAALSQSVEQRMGDFASDTEFEVILEANS